MIIIIQYLHCSSPYKFLTRLCNSYPLWPCLTKVVHVDGTDGSTVGCVNFLMVFRTPALLWRVLHFVGYHEPPLYHWNEEYLEGQPWYEVRLTIPARTQAPFWQEWKAESEGKTP